jgi:hypothetical protein
VALLFTLRFLLDDLSSGQISSLMLLGFALALDAWLARRPGRAGVALLIPSLLKVGPAFLYLWCALTRVPGRYRAWLAAGATFTAIALLSTALHGGPVREWQLWRQWLHMIVGDSSYSIVSHYGSQSLKSSLFRMADAELISVGLATALYKVMVCLGCGAIVWIWRSQGRSPHQEAVGFSLGILAYLWFMPETFKYSLPFLAIPVAVLLMRRPGRFEWTALGFGTLTLSLAGLDIVGERLFFGMQKASVPFLALLFLGAAMTRQASKR